MSILSVPYTLDNAWGQARRRLELLEVCYDPATIRHLQGLGVGPGWRCLEVGGGGGSITRWLCSTVGRHGHVTGVDLDTRFLDEIEADNLDVLRLDVTTAELPREAFDLIHTRAVLVHLPSREEVLDRLIAALHPGGWLLLEEPDWYPMESLGSGLYRQTWEAVVAAIEPTGMHHGWARTLPGLLQSRGLVAVTGASEMRFVEGASADAEFQQLTVSQLREAGLASGVPTEQLDAWNTLVGQPGTWFPGPAFVAVQGRCPGVPSPERRSCADT